MAPVNKREDGVDGTINSRATVPSNHDGTTHEQNSDMNVTLEQQVNERTPLIVGASLAQNNSEQNPEEIRSIVENLRILGGWLEDRISPILLSLPNVPLGKRFQQYKNIARGLIKDGISWGKIAVLFLFSVKFIVICGNQFLGKTGVFLVNLIKENLCNWIVANGGWNNVKDCVKDTIKTIKTTNGMLVVMFGVSCVTLLFAYCFFPKRDRV